MHVLSDVLSGEVKQVPAVEKEFVREAGMVAVRFEKNDPENPQEGWTRSRRYRALALAMIVTYVSAFNATGNGAASKGFRADHPDVTSTDFQISSFTYNSMLGLGPLILAPVSETFGRRPQIVICTAVICLLFLGMSLAPNLACLAVCRFLQGTAACIEGPTAAGVVADLWPKRTRAPAMSLFVLTVFTANATGPLCCNWIAQCLGWEWVYWIQMISNGVVFLLCLAFFEEPRADVILGKRCKRLEAETGVAHYIEGSERFEGWGQALAISVKRPLQYLFTEPIVTALSLYAGLAWGSVFLFVGAIAHVFQDTYGFSQGQAGTVLICGFIGAAISCILQNTVQERIYKRALVKGNGKAPPEVRLYPACIGGILFSAGLFAFGGTARESVHWIVPAIFIVIFNIGIYTIYLGTYMTLSDVYDRYSSSAQASQSLLRNLMGATFPFFGVMMYDKLTFPWASYLLGFLAAAFALVPWLLVFYGKQLRARSKVARSMEQHEGDVLPDDDTPPPHLSEVALP